MHARAKAYVTILATMALAGVAAASCGKDAATSPNGADASSEAGVIACNGHPELCSRAFSAVAFAGDHDAYATTSDAFGVADQTYPIAKQLSDGIRVLHFELHAYQNDTYACHASCSLGHTLWSDETNDIAAFMTANPNEVVALLLERSDTDITANAIGDAMKASGLELTMLTQVVGAPWPTLGDMIQKKQRLVAFLDDTTGSTYSWLLPRWQTTWETPWNNQTPQDFAKCNADRGTMGDGIFVVDTYLEDGFQSPAHSALVNDDPFLVDRNLYCQRATATFPNFVMVNYYEVGDVFHVVDVLNGFAPTPGDDLDAFPPASFGDASVGDSGDDAD